MLLGSTRSNSTGKQIYAALETAVKAANKDVKLNCYSAISPFNVLAEPINAVPPLLINTVENAEDINKYESEIIKEYSRKMQTTDYFIFLLPVYNHSYPGTFKIMMDHLFNEFKNKKVYILGYGPGSPNTCVEDAVKLAKKFGMEVVGTNVIKMSYTDPEWLAKQLDVVAQVAKGI